MKTTNITGVEQAFELSDAERASLAAAAGFLASLSAKPAGAVFNPGSCRWVGQGTVEVQAAVRTAGVAIPVRR